MALHIVTLLALALHILPPCGADCRPGVTPYSCDLTYCRMTDGSYRISPFNKRRH